MQNKTKGVTEQKLVNESVWKSLYTLMLFLQQRWNVYIDLSNVLGDAVCCWMLLELRSFCGHIYND